MIDFNENYDIPKRPDDWGINQLECILDESINALESFQKDPTVDRNELISHIRFPDINEVNPLGVFRVSDYTIYQINVLHRLGLKICSPMAIALSYRIVRLLVICFNMLHLLNKNIDFEEYMKKLPETLQYFGNLYGVYRYHLRRERPFAKLIVDQIENLTSFSSEDNIPSHTAAILCNFLFELTLINPCSDLPFINFCSEQAKLLLNNLSKLINVYPKLYDNRGLFHILVFNLLVKSRLDIESDNDLLYKFMQVDASKKAMENGELWCNEIHSMNDVREGEVIKDILFDTSWYPRVWHDRVKNVDNFPNWRTYYTCSFTRNNNYEKMTKLYGPDCYGYKDSLITELVAPITITVVPSLGPRFCQTMCYDVTYDKDVVKTELLTVMEFLDSLPISEEMKKKEWVEYFQYWIFSIKDEKWKDEAERRFCFFIVNDNRYTFIDKVDKVDNRLKIKTPILRNPDYLPLFHSQKQTIKHYKDAIVSQDKRSFIYCPTCLGFDFNTRWFDLDSDKTTTCRFCGKIIKIEN